MKSLYEQLGGIYYQTEDNILYPDLLLPEDKEDHHCKYGRLRLTYLKEQQPARYAGLLLYRN